MKSVARKTFILKNVAWAFLVLSAAGCGASKEETASQLQKHIAAYRNVAITPRNATNIIKGANTLLEQTDQNNFSKIIAPDQKAVLEGAITRAQEVKTCANIVDNWKGLNPQDNWKQWDPSKPSPRSSSQLKAEVETLKSANSCDDLISSLTPSEKSEMNRRIKETSNLLATTTKKEEELKRRKEAEERKQKCANAYANAEKARKNFLIYSNAGSSGNYGWASSMDYNSQAKDAWSALSKIREFISENCK